ncbi:MarR family winged helix-turn-helix transcriptional regulator [Pedobacter psychrodurus]|jgi:DNA-binding MarR family transcriptional regulator|uniref:MarR family winged helix-turn-helix transcriptional regulator n=1 Tax=Pedobacter psychrodurus TaxID=2530456 RepID=UPI00292EF8DF|nr:MarR family transcriptional regulator [Pedobacter psychrodurus]
MNTEKSHDIAAQLRPVLTRLVRKMRKLSPINTPLSQTERAVLVSLENQKLLAAELAVIEKITPQSMGQVITHLSSLGLIDKTPSETDKRKIYISISATGQDMIQQVRNERDEWLSHAIAKVCNTQEQEILKAAIGPLAKLVEF